jgi:uncharacterized protein (DUF2062 family)
MTPVIVPEITLQAPTPKSTLSPWKRHLRYWYLRVLRLQGSPQYLARGIASGVFSGCFPLFGLQIIIGVAIATVLRGNRIMAAAATWVSNPFTYVPLFAFNYQVGDRLLGRQSINGFSDLDSFKTWMDMGAEVSSRLMLGSTVVGIGAALGSYYGGIILIHSLRRRRIAR